MRVSLRPLLHLSVACGAAMLVMSCSGGQTNLPNPPTIQNGISNPNSGASIDSAAGASPQTVPAVAASGPAVLSSTSVRRSAFEMNPAPSDGQQVFSDDFSTDALGTVARGWSVADGTWAVCRFQTSQRFCATSSNEDEALAGSASWVDYAVDGVVNDSILLSGGAALLGRVQDLRHFYQLEVRKDYRGSNQVMWYIWKYDGITWMEIAGGPFVAHQNADYRLRLAFAGNQISAYVAYDDSSTFQSLGSGTDDSYASGKIGLRTWATNSVNFGNVVVTLNNSNPPAPSPPGNVANYHGCNIFSGGDYYNADVTNVRTDPHSSNYIASLAAVDGTGFYAADNERTNFATANTRTYPVEKVDGHQWPDFPQPFPWSSSFFIEPGPGDRHAIVLLVAPPACHLYESYETTFVNNTLSAYTGSEYDLSKAFQVKPAGAPSAMASGLSLFAGMVKHEEIAGGIHHALNLAVFSGAPCRCYTAPASSTDGINYEGAPSQYEVPYGGHLRLKATFDDSHFGPQSKAIAEALKHYGGYIADTGGHWSNNNAIYTAIPTDGGSWNGSDLSALNRIRFTDFEMLPVGHTTNL